MALRPVGVQFVTKGFSSFTSQIEKVNKQYKTLGKSINLTGNSISAFGAKLRVFNRQGKAYSQWVDEATGSFLSHSEVQKRFQGAIAGGSKSISSMGASFSKLIGVASKVTIVLGIVGIAIGAIKLAFKAVKKVITGVINVIKFIIGKFKKLASAIWEVFKSISKSALGAAINNIKNTLSQLKETLTQTISSFQKLEIQYESLIARQLRAEDSTLSISDSMLMASKSAQELLRWVQKVAVTTPFEVETIARTLALSQAMGFTARESKAITEAIINFTSAMGLSQETMDRIIQNFGQMRAAGKVTGSELRDLARGAMLPVNDILNRMGENLGVSKDKMDEFRDAAAKGEAPVDAFFRAFIDLANESFPSAAERMSRTFEGVKNNVIDFFKTVIGLNALGPVFDRITGIMADGLDNLLNPAVRRTAEYIGESLLQGFDMVWDTIQSQLLPAIRSLAAAFGFTGLQGKDFATVIARISSVISVAIEKVSAFINELAGKLSGQFGDIIDSAKAWGHNMILSLAEGMASAAKFVIEVLIKLGNVITNLLQPGSPPKLLPKLGKWGAAAMTEYMKGWLKADFSVFEDISGLVESFVRSISGTILKENNVVPIILEIRDSLAQAMNEINKSGKITQETLNEIFGALKGGTPELIKYVKLQLQLAEANKIVADAQKEVDEANKKLAEAQAKLNAVTAKYDAMLEPLKRKLDEISDRGDELDDMRRITQLQLILADVNASALDKERARIEIEKLQAKAKINALENEKAAAEEVAQADVDAAEEVVSNAEDKLEAAEEYRDAIADELAAQEALIKMQIDTNNLIKEQLELLESLKKKGGELGGTFEDLFENFGGILDPESSRKITGQLKNNLDGISQIFEDMKNNVSADIDEILGKFDGLGAGIEELSGIFSRVSTSFGDSRLYEAFIRIKNSSSDVFGSFTDLKTSIGDLITSFGNLFGVDFSGISGGISGIVITMIENKVLENLAILNGILSSLTEIADGLSERIDNLVTVWNDLVNIEGLGDFIDDMIGVYNALSDLTDGTQLFNDAVSGFWEGYYDIAEEKSRDIDLKVSEHTDATKQKFQDMANDLVGTPESITPKMMNDMNTEVSTGMTSMKGTIEDGINGEEGIVPKFKKMYDKLVGKSIIPDLMEEMKTHFGNTFLEVLDEVDTFVLEFLKKVSDISARLLYLLDLANQTNAALKSIPKDGGGKGDQETDTTGQGVGGRTGAPAPVIIVPERTVNNNFNLTMPTTANPASVQRAFGVMSVMVG